MAASLIAASLVSPSPAPAVAEVAPGESPARITTAAAGLAGSPIRFEPISPSNHRRGFAARTSSYSLSLRSSRVVFSLPSRSGGRERVIMTFAGARREVEIVGERRLPGVSNYLRGRDPSRWRTGVPGFARVRYREVYPGIDLIFYEKAQKIEYDFVVAPGADPDAIRILFGGVRRVGISPDGHLALKTSTKTLRHAKPIAYQNVDGARSRVDASFRQRGRRVGFDVGSYRHDLPLVIDPVVYASYFGGNGNEVGYDMASDGDGHLYLAGSTSSTEFPGAGGGVLTTAGETDAFVVKLDPVTRELIYATFIGGSDEDSAQAIALDNSLNAYITGATKSEDFPIIGAVTGSGRGGATDAFVAKLTSTGALARSSYLGGSGTDIGRGIDVDGAGNAYVAGITSSQCATANATGCFPTTKAYQATHQGGSFDGFVAKLGDSELVYSSYLGGGNNDFAKGIAAKKGYAYVTGVTLGAGLATTGGAYSTAGDGFVVKLGESASGSVEPSYSTRMWSCGTGTAIDVDEDGQAYIAGNRVLKLSPDGSSAPYCTSLFESRLQTLSSDLVLDPSGGLWVTGAVNEQHPAFASGHPWRFDAFASRIDEHGTISEVVELGGSSHENRLIGDAFFSGEQDRGVGAIAVTQGGVYLFGRTTSSDFDWIDPAQAQRRGASDGFLVKLGAPSQRQPEVIDIVPRGGPTIGGNMVTISGRGLWGATGVSFGGVPASGLQVESDERLTVVAPPHREGVVGVAVTTPSGTSVMSFSGSRYHYGEGAWATTDDTSIPRYGHTASLLPTGEVIVAGGCTSPIVFRTCPMSNSTDIYDPLTGGWKPGPSLSRARAGHIAAVLPDQRVLVSGGLEDQGTTELYRHGSGWATGTPIPPGTGGQATVWLPEGEAAACGVGCGNLLVSGGGAAGGYGNGGETASLHDPEAELTSPTGPLRYGRFYHDVILVPATTSCGDACGKALAIGGMDAGDRTTTTDFISPPEMYEPVTGTWRLRRDWLLDRVLNTTTLLGDGRVLVAGGNLDYVNGNGAMFPIFTSASEIYDPGTDEWAPTGSLELGRFGHSAVLLPNGKVLAVGGTEGGPLATAEIFDPALRDGKGSWRSAGSMLVSRTGQEETQGNLFSGGLHHSSTLLSSNPFRFEADPAVCGTNCGKVLIVGGSTEATYAELYTPAPSVTELQPSRGVSGRETQVTIAGTGFTHGVREVRFGDTVVACPSTACSIDSYSRLSVVAPEHDPGAVDVVVTNEGGYSSVADATRFTYLPPPGEVQDLAAQALSGSEIKLAFSAPAALGSTGSPQAPAQRFVIKQSATPISNDQDFAAATSLCNGVCSFTPPIDKVGDQVSLAVKDLAPATTYHYALKVIDDSGSTGPLSNQASATTAAVTPGAVSDLKAEPLSETKIRVRFSAAGSDGNKPPPIGDYIIVQSSEPITDERSFEAARRLCPDACSFTPQAVGDTLTLEVTDLAPGTTYHYALRPRDPHGNLGPRSNSASATTEGQARNEGQATPVERTIRLRLKGHLVATGKVRAEGPKACTSKVRVVIHRNRKKIKTITTKDNGRFRVRLVDRKGHYRATAQKVTIGDRLCLRAAAHRRHRH